MPFDAYSLPLFSDNFYADSFYESSICYRAVCPSVRQDLDWAQKASIIKSAKIHIGINRCPLGGAIDRCSLACADFRQRSTNCCILLNARMNLRAPSDRWVSCFFTLAIHFSFLPAYYQWLCTSFYIFQNYLLSCF